MDQKSARQRAKDLEGVAVQAHKSPSTGNWIIGGWATKTSTWIVVDTYPNVGKVLED